MGSLPLPFNAEVEAALIARLLQDPESIPLLSGVLHGDDFYGAPWRRAWDAMQRMAAKRQRVDIVTLQDALGDKTGEIGRLITEVPTFRAPIEEYALIVRRDAFRRRLIEALERVTARAYGTEDTGTLMTELHEAVLQVSQGTQEGRLISPAQVAETYIELLNRRQRGFDLGLLWGFDCLDKLVHPARGGDMLVLAARPSVGKTALAEMVSEQWAQQSVDRSVLFVSLEMSVGKLLDRTISRATGIPAYRIVRGQLDSGGHELAVDAAGARRTVNIWYLDDPNATTASVRSAAARVRLMTGGLAGIVVDYLQLLKDTSGEGSEVQRVTRISRQVKAIAGEFDVPLLVMSQLNRGPESREDPHPRLSDLRESGAIEQDADVVIGMTRKAGEAETDLEVLKQRQGETGMVRLLFDAEHIRFTEPPPIVPGVNLLTGMRNTAADSIWRETQTWQT
jgi:replicative DNA helicase